MCVGIFTQTSQAMVASGDEGEDKSQWPPELAALERQFTSKYQHQMAQLVEEHALEIADIKAECDAKISELVKVYSMKEAEAEEMPLISTGDDVLDKIIRERDSLRSLALTLRKVVQELAQYLTSCEDELNKSIVKELLKVASPHLMSSISTSDMEASDSEGEAHNGQRRVHFAPDVTTLFSLLEDDCLENSMVDVSLQLQAELESCLERLRAEAATVLGLSQGRAPVTMEDRRLTSLTRQLIEEKKAKEEVISQVQQLQDQVHKYESELTNLHKELTETKEMMVKEKIAEEVELSQKRADLNVHKLSFLQEKARTLLSEKGGCPPHLLGLIEELCVEGDCLIEEAYRMRDEQQLEVEAADKQLRSTRAFLDEQALEREQERDDYTRQIARLSELVRDRDRSRHFSSEVESLEQQMKELTEQLRNSEENKLKVEKELKEAIDKIWVLRDIIGEMETAKNQREMALERKVADLQEELDMQERAHMDMVGELQHQQGSSGDHNRQPSPHTHTCPPIAQQLKSQLRGMAKSLEKHIRELEAANIHVSCASLSSPSEDVSIREQLEALRCGTPEDGSCPASPSHMHVEELAQLSDKLLRYSRAAENLIKKLRDRDMEIIMLRNNTEELQIEREVLQGQSERQQLQLATLNKRVEDLRVRNERDMQASAAPLHQRIQVLEALNSDLENQLKDINRKLTKTMQKLDKSEALVLSQDAEISSQWQHQQELVDKLSQDLAAMRDEKQHLQTMVEKYRSEDNLSFPQLIEVMLAEKNADIDHLQQRVEELRLQQEDSSKGQSKSKSCRVSFADEVSHSRLTERERAREASHEDNSLKPFFSTPLCTIEESDKRLVPVAIGEDISNIPVPEYINLNSSPNRAAQLESVLSRLKEELEQKSQRLLECEAQLQELPVLEEELRRAKEELVETVMSVDKDKRFYEEQLRALGETKAQLAEREKELQDVKKELSLREEDMVHTRADIKALQQIMEGLQQKLQEAKTFTQSGDSSDSGDKKYKEECEGLRSANVSLKDQLSSLGVIVENEKTANKLLQETIDKINIEKEGLLSELNTTKSNCESLQIQLEKALLSSQEHITVIESLRSDLEASSKENNSLNDKCQKLKKELEQLSRKQKVELNNILKKDHEEAQKLREELESLKFTNSELQSACEKLQLELGEVGNNLELLRELTVKDEKIEELQAELLILDQDKQVLKDEKLKTEESLSTEIAELKALIEELNKTSMPVTVEEEKVKGRESLVRKYELLKREYERLRRAKREGEKKCLVLKDELTKEKQYSARLHSLTGGKRVPQLQVSKTNLVDIKPDGSKMTSSLDNLADEVQKELNASAQLDQSLITGLQSNAETGVEVLRSDNMAPHVEYLNARLAEAETAFHVERVVVSELRARLVEEHRRLMEERARTLELQEEVEALHTLNDQFEEKFKNIALQMEQQLKEVKDLRHNMEPTDTNVIEKEHRKLAEENQRKVDELLQERMFNKNQLLYLREELAKLQQEKKVEAENRRQSHGDNRLKAAMDSLKQAHEIRTRELEEERKRCASLQKIVEQVNLQNNQQTQGVLLAQHLLVEENLRQTLESCTRELEQERRRCAELERMLHQVNARIGLCDQQAAEIDYLKRKIIGEERLRKKIEETCKHMELAQGSRLSRRREEEEKLREKLALAEKEKIDMERECMKLQLKLKQSQIQLSAHSAESPLSLRLKEANMVLERLVKEKEDLNTANALLIEEKQQLQSKLRDHDALIEDLKSRIHALNIKVTDGGLDNVNAMFAAERAAWLKEKEVLRKALTQTQAAAQSVNSDFFNSNGNSAHFLQRYMIAESHRNALVWQKRYLLVALKGYQDHSQETLSTLLKRLPTLPPAPPPSPEHRFRVAVCAVRAVFRMQHIVNHRKLSRENTCRLLQHALNNNKPFPRRAENVFGVQNIWRKPGVTSSIPIQPGNLSHYLDHFNSLQDRIKNTLSTKKTEQT